MDNKNQNYETYQNVDKSMIINDNITDSVLLNKIYDKINITQETTKETTQKPLKVGLIVVEPYIIRHQFGIKSTYSGLIYDIWQQIKTINNLDIEEEIPLEPDYDGALEKLDNGDIDILIGNMWVYEDRSLKALYTRPLFLSKIVIAYKPKKNKYEIYYELFKKNYLIPTIIIFIIGIILGSLLFYVEPERGRTRAIWTTMSSFLGEMGFLFEESKLRATGMIVAFIIALLAFYYSLFLQATTTSDVIHEVDKKELSIQNLRKKRFAMPKNFDIGNILQKYHINYDAVDVEPSKIAEYYLENTDKYDGYLSEYESIKNDIKNNSEIKMSSQIYGYEENTFAIKNNNYELLNKINYSISKLQKNDNIKHLCEKYFGDEDANLCVL
jgi:ABC-type amino acid transport substrate-binding protein